MCNIQFYFRVLTYVLTSRRIPSRGVGENGAPSATVSTYLFHLVQCHQPQCFIHMPSGESSMLLRDLSPVSLLLYVTDVFPYLFYRSLFHPKSFLAFFIIHLFDVSQPAKQVLLHFHRDILASTCSSVYFFIADSIS